MKDDSDVDLLLISEDPSKIQSKSIVEKLDYLASGGIDLRKIFDGWESCWVDGKPFDFFSGKFLSDYKQIEHYISMHFFSCDGFAKLVDISNQHFVKSFRT
ncbi:hypothetical protein KJ785_03390, partial [Patescibacteria group bacterium]|nr:hypothetical protein [Patescibacteria group bacterium]